MTTPTPLQFWGTYGVIIVIVMLLTVGVIYVFVAALDARRRRAWRREHKANRRRLHDDWQAEFGPQIAPAEEIRKVPAWAPPLTPPERAAARPRPPVAVFQAPVPDMRMRLDPDLQPTNPMRAQVQPRYVPPPLVRYDPEVIVGALEIVAAAYGLQPERIGVLRAAAAIRHVDINQNVGPVR